MSKRIFLVGQTSFPRKFSQPTSFRARPVGKRLSCEQWAVPLPSPPPRYGRNRASQCLISPPSSLATGTPHFSFSPVPWSRPMANDFTFFSIPFYYLLCAASWQLAGEDRLLERRRVRARQKEAAGVIAKWLGRRLRHGNAPRGCVSQIASPRSISTKLPLSRSSECTNNRIRLNLSNPSILCS